MDAAARKPAWLKVRVPPAREYRATAALLDDLELHTVCSEARCPNRGECFGSGTATFLILGDVCTRSCGFCALGTGVRRAVPRPLDPDEPRRVAEAAARLGLEHVVITSVTRDDEPDGGAAHYAATIAAVRERLPLATVEVLIPDLDGDPEALATVFAARPDVVAHNLETVARLSPLVRPRGDHARSLSLLERAVAWSATAAPEAPEPANLPVRPRPLVKTGLMVGLGETDDEVEAELRGLAQLRLDLVTIGQYLPPGPGCLPVARYVPPARFAAFERLGADLGLAIVAGPLVRSSYRAGETLRRVARG